MQITQSASAALGAINISARGWQQIPDQPPGDDLTTVFLQGTDNAYAINISNTFFEDFYQYFYVWTVDSGVEQNDTLYTEIYGAFELGGGNDTITASVDPPALPAQFLGSYLLGGSGDDVIAAVDIIVDNALNAYGGSGNDLISGTWADDLLYGDEADYFYLWPNVNSIELVPYDASGDGNDTIGGSNGNDTIVGGGGDDILSGGEDDDLISAVSGNNQMFGGDGSDTITGGTGSDFLYGGPRGTGFLDILSGGGGADIFMLSYTEEDNAGSGFWGKYFDQTVNSVTGDAVKAALAAFYANGVKSVATGFVAGALGGLGDVLVTDFLSWIENLGPVVTPQEDILVIRDFDPSQDILVLPTAPGVDLSEPAPTAFNPDAAGDYRTGLQFKDNNTGKLYAELTLGDTFLASVGLTQTDTDEIGRILSFLTSNPTSVVANSGNFTSLSDLSGFLPAGGFTPPAGAQLPAGSTVLMFGAIGGLVYHSEPGDYANSFIVGTQYADVLTLNPVIADPTTLTNTSDDLTTTQSEVHGLGGDDIIYGTNASDILRGGDGNDVLYSFMPDEIGEDVSGGAGSDTIFGGGSFGAFDGGGGTDTFGVFYGQLVVPMQLFVDLANGIAGERAAPANTAAPVGTTPPFKPAADNTYTLTGIENVIGGTLNDWIRLGATGTVEGGAGADFILAIGGDVTFSYASSAEGVTVQLFASGPTTGGGDAEGDVLNYVGATAAGVIGSANADTLGGTSPGAFSFTGGGGADLFQVLSVTPSSTSVQFAITDFSQADGDLIDLRLIGARASDLDFSNDLLLIHDPGGSIATIAINLPNLNGTLTQADVLVADGVSGTGRTDADGGALSGGAGDDALTGQSGADFLAGNAGNDVIIGLGGADHVDGGRGNDRLRGDGGNDRLSGGFGADTIFGGDGNDKVDAGWGNDVVWVHAGNDRVEAGAGNDLVNAGEGNDVAYGGVGDDSLGGSGGNDTLIGQAGNDQVFGGDGRDLLFGQAGNDLLGGGGDADRIYGGDGIDTIQGAAGNDTIEGGAGDDVIRGGADADLFWLLVGNINGDAILDFDAAQGDRLLVRGSRPIGVADLGGGMFSFTDGFTSEAARVTGATLADFELLVV